VLTGCAPLLHRAGGAEPGQWLAPCALRSGIGADRRKAFSGVGHEEEEAVGYQLKVSTDDVAAKASAVRSQATELESQVAALTSQMAALADTWTGTAASAFQELYAQWRGQAGQIQQSLADISTSLNSAGTNYAEVEAANASGFSR